MALKKLWHRRDEKGQFVELHKEIDPAIQSEYKLYIYQGNAQDISTFQVREIPVTDDIIQKIEESYQGPDDPRLPDDVKKMSIGKREDFVSEFNFYYWFYDKDNDPDYNEDERLSINAVNYALKKAYTYANRERPALSGDPVDESQDNPKAEVEAESGIPESSLETTQESMTTADGKVAHRIRENVVGVVIPGTCKESKDDDGGADVDVVIIRKGWSLNGRYYGDKALEGTSAGINETKPGFMNHGLTFSRNPLEWAIYLHSAEIIDEEVHAKMHIFQHPNGDFLKERVEKAPHLFGGSIDAFVIEEDGKADGREGSIVQEVVLLNCWDIVMFPAAGGAISSTTESALFGGRGLEQTGEEETMDLVTLKEKHPALYELVIQQTKSETDAELKDLQEKLKTSEGQTRELQAELDGIKSAEKKRQEQVKFEKELKSLLSDTFEDDEVSEEFKALLIEEGSENMPRIKKMVSERRKTLDNVATNVSETSGEEDSSEENETSDEDELARFAA